MSLFRQAGLRGGELEGGGRREEDEEAEGRRGGRGGDLRGEVREGNTRREKSQIKENGIKGASGQLCRGLLFLPFVLLVVTRTLSGILGPGAAEPSDYVFIH